MEPPSPLTNVYHVAGLDDRDRGFSRQAQVMCCENGYQARLQYELLLVEVAPVSMEETALQRLIQVLQDRGYTQLRTQRIFQGEQYLGNQALWVEYPDREVPMKREKTWKGWLRHILGFSSPS